ncbi:MAG: hypothetical protein R6U19_05275, partial [Bacteroidales bacterium]
ILKIEHIFLDRPDDPLAGGPTVTFLPMVVLVNRVHSLLKVNPPAHREPSDLSKGLCSGSHFFPFFYDLKLVFFGEFSLFHVHVCLHNY